MITDTDRRRVAGLILELHALRRDQFKAYGVLDHPLEILLNLFLAHDDGDGLDRTALLTIGNSNPAVTGRWLSHLEGVSHVEIDDDRVRLRALGLAAVRALLAKAALAMDAYADRRVTAAPD